MLIKKQNVKKCQDPQRNFSTTKIYEISCEIASQLFQLVSMEASIQQLSHKLLSITCQL